MKEQAQGLVATVSVFKLAAGQQAQSAPAVAAAPASNDNAEPLKQAA
jgi:hypothetical protein